MDPDAHATRSAAPSSPTRQPPMLTIPLEIRRKIFTLALTSQEQPVHMHLSPSSARHKSVLRLLLVCRQIYVECLPLFYRHNALVFGSTSALYTFLSTLSPARRKQIKSLAVENYGFHYSSSQMAGKAFDLLGTCDRLTTFHLDLSPQFRLQGDSVQILQLGQKFEQKQWIAGMTSLKKLRGLLEGSIRILSDGDAPDSEPRMVELTKGKWGLFSNNMLIRWKRPPLWGLDERGEAEKRMRRWRKAVDRFLKNKTDIAKTGATPWHVYEVVVEACMKDLGSDSEPDDWL